MGLELGGKNPQIIMDDANLELAIEGVLFGAFGTAGQRCTATSRLIVHENIFAEAVGKLLSRTRTLKIGDPLDPQIDVGPVASGEQERKILQYIRIGIEEGAKLLCGGRSLPAAHTIGDFLSSRRSSKPSMECVSPRKKSLVLCSP